MSTNIHPTAIVSSDAHIGEGCEIGPYCVIEGPVVLGKNNKLISHVRLEGETSVADNNTFYPFCSVGGVPQDLKYKGERSFVRIGSGNSIRECVTIHRGTLQGSQSGESATVLGDDNLIMAYTHIAHDCILGSRIVLANGTQVAGHVVIEDEARLGGANMVVQRVRIGTYAFTGAGVVIRKDIAPYVVGAGSVFKPSGINRVGLERAGFLGETIDKLREAFRLYFLSNLTHEEALKQLREISQQPRELQKFVSFLEETVQGVHR